MNNENFRKLKIVHMALVALAIILDFISLIENIIHPGNGVPAALKLLMACIRLVALFCGSIYLIFGYKKNVAGFYQATFIAMAASLLCRIFLFVQGHISLLQGICSVISLVALLALSFGKDLGRQKTSIIYGVLLVCEILMTLPMFADLSLENIATALSTLIIAGTLGIMITGKYIDKESRGSK